MMKKIIVLSLGLLAVVIFISCSDVPRTPGRDYMPDMKYSRAYETYAPRENLKALGINYNASPVVGTVKRGEIFPYPINKDQDDSERNYTASRQVVNPLAAAMDTVQYIEAERLYLINCAICHGTNLDGNGPLYNGGNGPYPAAPRNLVGDAKTVAMPEGQLFYSVTYGKGVMGPYGSQLSTSQRWRIVHFVKMKQLAANGGKAPAAGISAGAGTGSNDGNSNVPKVQGSGAVSQGAAQGTSLSK